ncbi:MAG: hypothetical protein V4685_18060 [Bacteroidota bacterium]
MKPLPIIISIVLVTISIIRLANSCSKKEQREKSNAFQLEQQSIEWKRQAIFSYDKSDVDSIDWMDARKELFDETLDSSIKRHRDNYYEDQERHKAYLNTLYAYKKLSYLYSDWIKYNREYAKSKKKDTILHRVKYRDFYNSSRSIMFRMNMDNIGTGY